jgi:hypothetical protein
MIDDSDGAIERNIDQRATRDIHPPDISLGRRFMHKFPTAFER